MTTIPTERVALEDLETAIAKRLGFRRQTALQTIGTVFSLVNHALSQKGLRKLTLHDPDHPLKFEGTIATADLNPTLTRVIRMTPPQAREALGVIEEELSERLKTAKHLVVDELGEYDRVGDTFTFRPFLPE